MLFDEKVENRPQLPDKEMYFEKLSGTYTNDHFDISVKSTNFNELKGILLFNNYKDIKFTFKVSHKLDIRGHIYTVVKTSGPYSDTGGFFNSSGPNVGNLVEQSEISTSSISQLTLSVMKLMDSIDGIISARVYPIDLIQYVKDNREKLKLAIRFLTLIIYQQAYCVAVHYVKSVDM